MKTTHLEPAGPPAVNGSRTRATFDFEVADVTGTHQFQARDVQRTSPAGAVARTLANRMALPKSVPWTLRHDRTGAYLDEESPIGDQIDTGAKVVVTPKAHLG